MSDEQIKNILGSINYEIETDKNWVEPIGLDRDAWKALLKYIQQKENIIKEVREEIIKYKEILETGAEQNVFYIYLDSPIQKLEGLLEILDKEDI